MLVCSCVSVSTNRLLPRQLCCCCPAALCAVAVSNVAAAAVTFTPWWGSSSGSGRAWCVVPVSRVCVRVCTHTPKLCVVCRRCCCALCLDLYMCSVAAVRGSTAGCKTVCSVWSALGGPGRLCCSASAVCIVDSPPSWCVCVCVCVQCASSVVPIACSLLLVHAFHARPPAYVHLCGGYGTSAPSQGVLWVLVCGEVCLHRLVIRRATPHLSCVPVLLPPECTKAR